MTSFNDIGISKEIIRAMDAMGWKEPTPVQIEAIPVGLKGGDMFAQAQTGTGKTGAYGSIILQRQRPGGRNATTLVLVPTRELATQVTQELTKLGEFTGHKCVAIYGGVGYDPQINKLRRGADIIIATPGRAVDLLNRRDMDLSSVSMVVLDEADRMLDMGFAKDLHHILNKVPKKRQTLLFSATMSKDIRHLAMKQMVNPKEVLVSKDEIVLDLTKQYYLIANKDLKRDALCTILDSKDPKCIVFCHTKRKVDQLTKKLKMYDYRAGAIHGDVAQNKRERVLNAFKDGTLSILVATDVAARGLDIDDVDYVFNYDAPIDLETYVHRIGRTGRAGREGIAISFFIPEEKKMIRDLEARTGKTIALLEMDIVKKPEPDPNKKPKDLMPPKPQIKALERRVTRQKYNKVSIEINFGKGDQMSKAEVMDLVKAITGMPPENFGRIAMGEKFTHIEILNGDAAKIGQALNGMKFGGKTVEARPI